MIFDFLKKIKNKQNDVFQLEKPNNNFIPTVCHIDDHNVLLKNGHLVQTFKIVGYSDEIVENNKIDARNTIRNSLNKHITDPSFSVWVHTIRTKKNLDPNGRYNNKFAKDLINTWNKKNYWHEKYVNEVYISIVKYGHNFQAKELKDKILSFSHYFYEKKIFSELDNIANELNKIVDLVVNDLVELGAKKLGIYSNKNGIFSEPLEFFKKVLNFDEKEVDLPVVDFSDYLTDYKVAFGNNSFQIIKNNQKHFGAIITLKEYHEINNDTLMKLISIPSKMVICQSINFTAHDIAINNFKEQDYILKVSLDMGLRKTLGLENLLDNESNLFGHAQSSIVIYGDTINQLNQNIDRCAKELDKIGLVYFREDLCMEDIYWWQIPGNFNFIRRGSPISFKYFSGFAGLNNMIAGKKDSIWGKAVTLFRSALGTPYYFNFHNEANNGNTCIIGDNFQNHNTLLNFLATISTKYDPAILFLTNNNRSKLTINSLDFKTYKIEDIEFDNLNKNRKFFIDYQQNIQDTDFFEELKGIINEFINANNSDSPFIIILQDIEKLNINEDFKNYLLDLHNIVSNKKGVIIYTMEYNCGNTSLQVASECQTKIIFTGSLNAEKATLLKISDNELKYSNKLNEVKKEFLIINSTESVVAELNLSGINNMLAILRNTHKASDIFEKNKNSENWLEKIYQSTEND
jgi:type IV secretion system protein VirB4